MYSGEVKFTSPYCIHKFYESMGTLIRRNIPVLLKANLQVDIDHDTIHHHYLKGLQNYERPRFKIKKTLSFSSRYPV